VAVRKQIIDSKESTEFRTSLSSQTKMPVFNVHSFDLGDILAADADTELIFTAYQVRMVKGKETTEEVGSATVPLYSLHLTQYNTKIPKPLTFMSKSGNDAGRIVATFTLLNDSEQVANSLRPLIEKLQDPDDVLK